ncbi:MAG: hypothetical protein J6Y23_10165 [Prevotella sp.]|nr:hypothetical protein [Prevotella sp.]
MKKIYSAPLTECEMGFYGSAIMGLSKKDDNGNWGQDLGDDEETDEDGRANPGGIWDRMEDTLL